MCPRTGHPAILSALVLTCTLSNAQTISLRDGFPDRGAYTVPQHYLRDFEGVYLPTTGEHWTWDLDSVEWVNAGEGVDTVWHHDETKAPTQGGLFSVFSSLEHCYNFFHVQGDTLLQDSAWWVTQGTTQVEYAPSPLCWQGQVPGDSIRWNDPLSGVDRCTRFRGMLDLRTPWGRRDSLLVFEEHMLDFITFRIHRKEDLVREVARYKVQDGLYLRWPGMERGSHPALNERSVPLRR